MTAEKGRHLGQAEIRYLLCLGERLALPLTENIMKTTRKIRKQCKGCKFLAEPDYCLALREVIIEQTKKECNERGLEVKNENRRKS